MCESSMMEHPGTHPESPGNRRREFPDFLLKNNFEKKKNNNDKSGNLRRQFQADFLASRLRQQETFWLS